MSKTDGFVEKQKLGECPKSDRIVPKTNKGVQNQTVPPENGLQCIVQKKYGHVKKRAKVGLKSDGTVRKRTQVY